MLSPRTARGLGSGTIIESCGYSGTDDHEVMSAKTLQIELFDGTKLPVQVAGCDPLEDQLSSTRPTVRDILINHCT
jgi:S1-C subfamily serine protease